MPECPTPPNRKIQVISLQLRAPLGDDVGDGQTPDAARRRRQGRRLLRGGPRRHLGEGEGERSEGATLEIFELSPLFDRVITNSQGGARRLGGVRRPRAVPFRSGADLRGHHAHLHREAKLQGNILARLPSAQAKGALESCTETLNSMKWRSFAGQSAGPVAGHRRFVHRPHRRQPAGPGHGGRRQMVRLAVNHNGSVKLFV